MSPEQEAERDLDDTIRRLAPTMGVLEDGELIGSWILVGHAVPATEDESSRYFHVYSGGQMPLHAAVGLLRLAQVTLEATQPED